MPTCCASTGYWKGEHYGAAAELIETIYGADPADLLSQPARMNIIRAAVGFVLANDKLGLSRLRSKFGERMAQTPEWPMFDYVTEHDRPPRASSSASRRAKVVAGSTRSTRSSTPIARSTGRRRPAPDEARTEVGV